MANFLGNLIGAPEMGNDMMLPNMSAGIDASLQRNQQLGQMQQQQRPKSSTGGTLRNILGTIGDALLINAGHKPVYAEHQQRRRSADALANYLGNSDAALAEMVASGVDLGDAVVLYKMKHPEADKQPGVVQEWLYRRNLPEADRADYDKYVESRRFNPFASPITMGPNDTLEVPGEPAGEQAQGEVTATDASGNKVRYNPQSGQWEPMQGGPAASPPATFP